MVFNTLNCLYITQYKDLRFSDFSSVTVFVRGKLWVVLKEDHIRFEDHTRVVKNRKELNIYIVKLGGRGVL